MRDYLKTKIGLVVLRATLTVLELSPFALGLLLASIKIKSTDFSSAMRQISYK